MLRKIFNNIPDGGTLTLTIKKTSDDNICIGMNRSFPGTTQMQPLVLSGSIEDMEKELPDIMNAYRRTTNMRSQGESAIKANEAKPAKSSPSKVAQNNTKKSDDADLKTDGASLFEE